jgi:hypothetical protein
MLPSVIGGPAGCFDAMPGGYAGCQKGAMLAACNVEVLAGATGPRDTEPIGDAR